MPFFFSESWPSNTRAEAGTNNRGRRGHSQAKVTFVRPPFGWLWIVPIEKSSCKFKQITECWNLRWHWAFTKKPTISNNLWVPMRQVDTCEGVLQPTQRYVWNDVKALKPLGTVNLFPPNYGSFSWKRKATEGLQYPLPTAGVFPFHPFPSLRWININQVDPSVTILMTPFGSIGSIIGIPLDDLSMFLSTRILQVTANPRFRHQTWLCCKLRQGPAWRGSNHSRENQPWRRRESNDTLVAQWTMNGGQYQ